MSTCNGKVFSKARHYNGAPPADPSAIFTTRYPIYESTPSSSTSTTTHQPPPAFVWVSTHPTQPQGACSAALHSFWRHFYRVAQPTLRTVGQCMFGLAMLFIIAGIALCIWGYVGTAIPTFQLFGPVCIGVGLLIYIVGCVLCCREYPAFERALQERALQERVRSAVELLAEREVVDWIQGEPEVYEDFKEAAYRILHTPGFYSTSGNIITNVYTDNHLHAEIRGT